jgi:hypothetical protein
MPGVALILPDEEPEAGPWRVESISGVVRILARSAGSPLGRPCVIAIDGRSSSS